MEARNEKLYAYHFGSIEGIPDERQITMPLGALDLLMTGARQEGTWNCDFTEAPRDGTEIIAMVRNRSEHWTRYGFGSAVVGIFWDADEGAWTTGGCGRHKDEIFACWRPYPEER